MPIQAKQRAIPALLQAEWEAPTLPVHLLTQAGGVSVCPRDQIAETVARCGATTRPCAILITQTPEEVGLRSYLSQEVHVTLKVATSTGTELVSSKRHLVQLGFGHPVAMHAPTDFIVDAEFTMEKVT
eukprot:5894039-Amphidinium_carterae.1